MSKLWTYHVLAHCRRTDSDRPHRCCYLSNSVEFIDCVQTHAAALHGSRRILSIRDNGPGDAPKCLFSRGVGDPALHLICGSYPSSGWLGSRVVSVLDSGAEGPGFKSQPRRCRVTVLGKLFTPTVPLFTKQRNW